MIHVSLTNTAQAQIPDSPTVADIVRTTWNEVIMPAVIFLFLLATVVFIWGLVQFIARSDDEEGRNIGKKHIVWGLIGMSIMIATGAIMTVINNFITSL